MGRISILARGKKWMNISFYRLLLLAPMMRLISTDLLAWMGTSQRFNRASWRPWSSDVSFAVPHCHGGTHPGTDVLPETLALGMCWEATTPQEGGTDVRGNGHKAAVGPDSSSACGLNLLLRTAELLFSK